MKRTMLLLSISVLAVVILASVQLGEAQQAGKIYRIGYLSVRETDREKHLLAAFHQGLRERGYVEGKNIVIHSFTERVREQSRLIAKLQS